MKSFSRQVEDVIFNSLPEGAVDMTHIPLFVDIVDKAGAAVRLSLNLHQSVWESVEHRPRVSVPNVCLRIARRLEKRVKEKHQKEVAFEARKCIVNHLSEKFLNDPTAYLPEVIRLCIDGTDYELGVEMGSAAWVDNSRTIYVEVQSALHDALVLATNKQQEIVKAAYDRVRDIQHALPKIKVNRYELIK